MCCSWAEGCGKCPGGWQPDVPPSWPSLLQVKAGIGSRRGQWQVEKDTHHSVGLCWCPFQPPAAVLVKSPLDQAEHQPCHCLSAWICVTSHPPVWRDWHGCSQLCGSVFLKPQSTGGGKKGENIMKIGEITMRKGR